MRHLLSKYLVSSALGVTLIWLAFRDEDWSSFGDKLESVDLGMLALYIGLFSAGHMIRIARWGVLVRALGPVPWRDVLAVGSVGYMCIVVFPLRLGELVRPYLIRGYEGVRGSGVLATVVVERVIDGLMFVGLFFVVISILPDTGGPAVEAVKIGAYGAGAVFVSTLVVLIAGYVQRARTVAIIERIGKHVHAGLTRRVVGLLDAFLEGLRILPDRRRIGGFMVLTAVYWAILGVSMQIMGHATGIPDLDIVGAFAVLAVLVVGIMVPGGPGFAGTFEFAVTAGFSLLALAPTSMSNVALYTIVLHVTQLVVQVGFGSLFLITGQVQLGGAVRAVREDEVHADEVSR